MNYITILFIILTIIMVIHTELGPIHKTGKDAGKGVGYRKKSARARNKAGAHCNQSQSIP